MKKILLAAVLLLGMSTTTFAQFKTDKNSSIYGYGITSSDEIAIRRHRLDEKARGFRIAFDGGNQRVLKWDGLSLNNSRFDCELGYRFNRISYIGASIGVNTYRQTINNLDDATSEKAPLAEYDGKKVGMPLSLIYRAYLMERFVSPYAYLRGTTKIGAIEDINLGLGVGLELNLVKGASIFGQVGISGMGFIGGESFFKSRVQSGLNGTWDTFSAGPIGEFALGVRIPLSSREL